MGQVCLQVGAIDDFLARDRIASLARGASFRSCAQREVVLNGHASPEEVVATLVDGGMRSFISHQRQGIQAAFWCGDVFVNAWAGRLGLDLTVFAVDGTAGRKLDEIIARLDAYTTPRGKPEGVWAAFSSWGGAGIVNWESHFLPCPTLSSIRDNYARAVRDVLDALFADSTPWELGRLIVWSGPAGAGKTHALRALLRQWADLFRAVVVNDPERFAAEPGYYTQMAGTAAPMTGPEAEEAAGRREGEARPRLFVMEDAADLILSESRGRHFDKVGKLLNITDGLFSQSRRDMFLLTFNEDVSEIDPAFLRPGRCRAHVHFPKLSEAEADAWLERHGLEPSADGETALADLYRRLHETRRGGGKDVTGSDAAGRPRGASRIGFGVGPVAGG